MKMELNAEQKKDQAAFRAVVSKEIVPHADEYDRQERVPFDLIKRLGREGYLGATLPTEYGGRAMDMITYGLLNEELGRGCSSVRALVMLQNMIGQTILRWGNRDQKGFWLNKLASGEALASFALTEPDVGSDASNVQTAARPAGDNYIINGRKKWITLGQIADLFLVLAQWEGQPCAFLVEKDTPGLSINPLFGMLGARASLLAELHFDDCPVPAENLVGAMGFGLAPVAFLALNIGRYSVAWGCVGIAQACLEACIDHTSKRKQFGVYLKEHQLIKHMIADMVVKVKAGRLLCIRAGSSMEAGDPSSVTETMVAKYFASQMASEIANDAVQIHGALGCSREHGVERYLRDAKVMEIIEGTTQILQMKIAEYAYQEHGDK
ncbi:MAG: acyl-CoA dehydrogenase family protein [Thermodesulfobacteriota bacterium]|nr:acyl-CoA dehydrogenase family protein [Thermodesulfobacteriota bacterium]